MRRFLFTLIVLLLGATFLRGWQSSPVDTRAVQASACVDIPASPDYLESSSQQDAIAAINNARAVEHLGLLRLPTNFYQLDAVQQQFILINQERMGRGLKPLNIDANLSRIAQNYSRQMRDLHFFSHTSPIAGTFSERVNSDMALSGHYMVAGENLAGNPVPGAGAMYEYMYDDSAENCGHRLNILDPNMTMVGIGEVAGGPYGSISAQEFLSSASWNAYQGTQVALVAPHVSIMLDKPGFSIGNQGGGKPRPYPGRCPKYCTDRVGAETSGGLVNFYAQAQPGDSDVRITWFLDRIGNLPFTGPDITLDLSSLAPGKHTLLVYVVNGEQNYSMATYVVGI